MIRLDLHMHTTYSPDSTIQPKTIVDQLNAHPSIKAVAVTDHNTVEGYYKVYELAKAYADILIVPAVEISAAGGDIIILGIAELPPKPWKPENITDFTKQKGALAIAAHPYRAYGLGDSAKAFNFDAIETLNGISSPNVNRQAEQLAKTMNLPGVAGSDAHNPEELWTAYTEAQASSDIDEILKAIKKGFVKAAAADRSIRF